MALERLRSGSRKHGPPELILASTSPYRRALLEAAGLSFRAVAPQVDERAAAEPTPRRLARRLASLKAEAVANAHPAALVIGSDQTVDLEGELLHKPGSRAEARRQLTRMAGRSHWLHTAVAVRRLQPGFARVAVESVKLTLRPLSRRELEAYLDTDEWQGCAGGYRVEGQGLKIIEAIRGDYHAIVGLPMLKLLGVLREAGYPLLGAR